MSGRRHLKMWLAACWLGLALAGLAAADTHYVNPGDSIQDAINAAESGDEIEVAPGAYNEAINFLGKAIRLYSTGGPGATTISAGGLNSSVVTCNSGENANTKLEGFTITRGNAFKGGGMYISGGSSPTVTDCMFTENIGEYGGGMYTGYGSHPTVTNCTFWLNTATVWGGGMFNKQSNPTVTNSTFLNNNANWDGGGMFNDLSNPKVTDCTFDRNSADKSGGGMYSGNDSSPTVSNCKFSTNRAWGTESNTGGAGMYNDHSSPTVTDCTFTGNKVSMARTGGGGGMYNEYSNATVTNCTFEDNTTGLEGLQSVYGGAMYNHESNPTLANCTFSSNVADGDGGAMYNDHSSPTVTNCIFSANEAEYGGGMCNNLGSPTVTNCTFSDNSAAFDGGGMWNGASSPTVTNCIFSGNQARYGGGMFNTLGSPTVTNCTFSDNSAAFRAGGMHNVMDNVQGRVTVTNCILWGNSAPTDPQIYPDATVSYSDVQGGYSGTGNIDADPMFADAQGRLSAGSPCIDAGNNDAVPAGVSTDLAGNPRFVDDPATPDTGSGTPPIVDMGAYEFQPAGPPPALAARWKLDEASGTTAHDSAGGNHGSLYGNPIWRPTSGMIDGALEFDGVDDYVDCGNDPLFDLTEQITIAAWVTITSVPGDYSTIIAKGNTAWRLSTDQSERKFQFAVCGPPWVNVVNGDTEVGTAEWHHVCGTYDRQEIRLYVDGLLDATLVGAEPIPTNAYNVCIGQNAERAGRYWHGLIDDVRVYDYALSQSQIQALIPGPSLVEVPDVVGETQDQAEADILAAGLTVGTITEVYSDTVPAGLVISQNPAAGALVPEGTSVDLTVSLGPAGPPPSGLVAHWKLDEGFGSVAFDSSGKDNHGALVGPVWLPDGGMIDGALEFDGLDDYVDCGNSASLGITYEITVAAWVNTNDAGNSEHNPYVTKGDHSYALKHYFNNSIEFFIYDGDWQGVHFDVDDSFNGVWHHLAGTYDGFELKLYLDGEPQATTPHEGLIASSSFNVYLASNSEMTDRYYEGLLDDVRIYNCALNQSEIQALIPSAPLVEVPDVVGETQAQAEADIVAVDLTVGTITEVYSNTVPAGLVISQNPAAGALVPEGTSVDLTISLGPVGPPPVEVPDVVGQMQAQAEADILAADLTVGAITEVYSDTVLAGRVISQNPAAGALVPEGTSVDLTVSLGPVGPPPPGVLAHWKLDESSGDIAEDSAGDNDGSTYGGPVWLPDGGMMDGALAFDGVDDYVSLPIGSVINSLTKSTFATWVDFANTGGAWQRIFDFGNNTTTYMFLTPRMGMDGPMRFGITIEGGGAPEQLATAPDTLASGWHHVAVTIDADINTVNLYLDGVVVASNIAVTLTPSDLGNTTRNRLGRSQYSADAYFDGSLDDFRIYDYALSQSEIQALIPGPALVEVPDVVGQTRTQAEADIVAAELTVGTITEAYSDTVPAGYVISQNPAPGTPLDSGSAVDLLVSLGPAAPPPVKVPDVLGQTQAQAEADIVAAGLTVGTITEVYSDTVPAGRVISQNPTAGALVPEGTSVDLTVSLGPVGPPPPGLVAHWKLDESSGDIAEDSAGDNDGILYGNPVWLPTGGMMDGALAFDGVGDYVSLPIGSLIASLTDCTFATWVDFSNLGGPWQRIFDFGNNRTAYMFLTPRLDTDGPMRFGITIQGGGAPEQLVTAPHTLPSGWHHVAVTIDADINTVNLYLDGVVVASNIAVTLTPSDLGNTTKNWLGRSQYSADAYFDGSLDDFRIYDYALTTDEIVKLLCIDPPPGDTDGDCRFDFADVAILFSNWLTCNMTDGEESANPGLVAHYKLDEGSGTIAADASGNGHDGIAQNGEPNWVEGHAGYGTAMHWAGQNPAEGWISCGSWNPSAVTGQLTVATWAKWDGPTEAYQGLIGKRDGWDDQGTNMMWSMEISRRTDTVGFARGGVYPPCGDVVLPVGEWSHVAVTFDGTTMVFYSDGAETGRGAFSFGSKTDATIVFGCAQLGGANGFNGALDDIRLYDYALSPYEIYEIVQVSCTDPPPGDANNDCRFDFADLDILFSDWLTCTLPVEGLCGQLTSPEPPVPPARSNWSPEWTSTRIR